MADWHWEPVTDDLLDCLPPAALAAVRQLADELADTRVSMTGLPAERAASVATLRAQVRDPLRRPVMGPARFRVRGAIGDFATALGIPPLRKPCRLGLPGLRASRFMIPYPRSVDGVLTLPAIRKSAWSKRSKNSTRNLSEGSPALFELNGGPGTSGRTVP